MITPELSARLSANGLSCVLRADAIRRDTLVQLAQAWAEGDGRADIEDALDHLANVLASPKTTDGELDAAVLGVEDAAAMDHAEIHIDKRAAASLRRGLGAVIARLSGRLLNTVVPAQRARRTA
ncbi:MAG TPA: hypothetical protein VHU40_00550 [Polyangia bacterium]|jgi:hypothetical protein|nr:hypothetical protein [Polyangia bacterium]